MSTNKNHNLNEIAGQDYFEMILDDETYRMTYPSAQDVMDLEKVSGGLDASNKRLEAITVQMLTETDETHRKELIAEAEGLKKELEESGTNVLDWAVKYVKPVNEKAPDFKETLMNKPVKYLMAFINLLTEELES